MSTSPGENQEQAHLKSGEPAAPPPDAAASGRRGGKRWLAGGAIVAAALAIVAIQLGWLPSPTAGYGEPSPTRPAGTAPTIISLTAATDRIMPLASVEVTCEATDPDGDELTYLWSTSDGEIVGDGATVRWLAPETEGLYRLFVEVDDAFDGRVEASLSLSVRSNQMPEILFMNSELGEDDDWVVPGARVHVRSQAEDLDGDPLTYRWSSTGGEIFGEGEAIIWIAPQNLGMDWVTVRVEDAYGGSAERSIPITVNAAEPPAILGLTAEALDTDLLRPYGDSWRIFKERSCTITALVTDEESNYTYQWESDRGTIVEDGPVAVWTAPESPKGWVNIVLTVSDRHGNQSSAAIRIFVETCPSCM